MGIKKNYRNGPGTYCGDFWEIQQKTISIESQQKQQIIKLQYLVNDQTISINKLKRKINRLKSKIVKLEFRPNEVINCPSCNIDIEIDSGGEKFNESKENFKKLAHKKIDL